MRNPTGAKLAAWLVHAYTALGAPLGLLALKFAAEHRFRACFAMMAAATVIDSSDGPLARWFQVKQLLPIFDGALLDNIVDYLTYVIAPLFMMLCAGMLPAGAWGLSIAWIVVLASAYGFCRTDAKTSDHFFLGFPSYWNLVAFYLFCFQWGRRANAATLLIFAALVFVPLKYIYPNRTEVLRRLTLALGLIWALLLGLVLKDLPTPKPVLVWLSFTFVAYYLIMSVAIQAWTAWVFYRRWDNGS